jgi:hypothetical protein
MTRNKGGITRGARAAVLVAVIASAGATITAAAGAQANSRPQTGASAVPKGFRANSITWLSPERGWVLGSAPCPSAKSPDSGPPPKKSCSYVIGTTNGSKTWSLLGSIKSQIVSIGQSEEGVTEIRFATPEVGWAFGPELFRTINGGRTWTSMPIPGGGGQVSDLATNAGEAYAVVSPCKWATPGACSQHPYTLLRTAKLTGATWTRISVNLTPPKSMYDSGSDLAVYGRTVYVLMATSNSEGTVVADKFYASTDGLHFSSRHDPCRTSELIDLVQAVPTSATDVTLLCEGSPGLGSAEKAVYRSTNAGKTDSSAGSPSAVGIGAELAASPSGNLAVSSASGASFVDVNDTHKTTWTTVITEADGGVGWNDIVYVTGQEAYVVYEPVEAIYPFGRGQVFVTHDGGKHWTVVAL